MQAAAAAAGGSPSGGGANPRVCGAARRALHDLPRAPRASGQRQQPAGGPHSARTRFIGEYDARGAHCGLEQLQQSSDRSQKSRAAAGRARRVLRAAGALASPPAAAGLNGTQATHGYSPARRPPPKSPRPPWLLLSAASKRSSSHAGDWQRGGDAAECSEEPMATMGRGQRCAGAAAEPAREVNGPCECDRISRGRFCSRSAGPAADHQAPASNECMQASQAAAGHTPVPACERPSPPCCVLDLHSRGVGCNKESENREEKQSVDRSTARGGSNKQGRGAGATANACT